ncbi:HNH endonuclease signature motif containing protein [Arthrobacter sp. 8AJ]|uniref:HNH endonuclease signature motif containing protein n=1 Tax=Arthrobacter sp. 8AJ TaxID=2653130 RepID=UPI0013596581|nr:HNH endonuclease signature motif containing protein [Arthrobacter sp. 8AJ]
MARLEAQLAAVKAETAAEAVEFQQAMTPPDASIQDRTYGDMSVVEEVAGVLTISSAAAGALVEQSRRICLFPPVFEALSAGSLSWQHAKIIADETDGLDAAGAAGLVAHLFDPAAANPARGAAPGELVPSRFRAKVRGWRERHHPDSIEKRHAKGAADRRMEYVPGWIRMRDTKCTFPGCTNRTPDNETDHLQAWQHGGTTNVSNLAQLCPKHHRLKHHSQWTPDPATKNEPPGWTSPTGRHYKPEHPDPEPSHWPQWRGPEWMSAAYHSGGARRLAGGPPDFHYMAHSPGEDALLRCLHSTS